MPKMTEARARALFGLQRSIDYHRRNGWYQHIDAKTVAGAPKDRSVANLNALVEMGFATRRQRDGYAGGSFHWTFDITDLGRAENAKAAAAKVVQNAGSPAVGADSGVT